MSIPHPDPHRLAEIETQGFTLVRNMLESQDIPELRERLQICIDQDLKQWEGKPYIDQWMVHHLMTRGWPFAHQLENPVMHAYLSALLADTCIIYGYTSSSLPPHGINYSCRLHIDCPRFIPGYVTNVGVMVALDDYTDDNGASYFLPGSHQRPDPVTEEEFAEHAVRVYPKAGDAVIFNARTWHKGGINRTDLPRHSITFNVCRSFMRQRFDYPRLVPPDVVGALGEIGRRFLGFNVRMPTSLEEYYLPEAERLYKANQG